MAKSADAFRTISEVADWLDTPAHVLRFWESKFAQVKPVKRAGGRRYYRPSDMLLLGGIKKLLHTDGMTIKGVQKLLREHGVKHVAGHSQPLDDITAAEDKAATIEAPEAKVEAVEPIDTSSAPPAVAESTPVEVEPEAAAEPEVIAASESEVEPAEETETEIEAEAPADEPAEESEENDDAPVMPAFSHRPAPDDAPADHEVPAGSETPSEAEAPAPEPIKVDLPDDPADDMAADPGILTRMAALKAPVSDDMADRLGDVLDRLRQSVGGNGTGPNG